METTTEDTQYEECVGWICQDCTEYNGDGPEPREEPYGWGD